jgi:hypothetical protein
MILNSFVKTKLTTQMGGLGHSLLMLKCSTLVLGIAIGFIVYLLMI